MSLATRWKKALHVPLWKMDGHGYPQHLEELVHKVDGIVGEFLANQGCGLVGITVITAVSCVADGVV
jgi:hypothetical protein